MLDTRLHFFYKCYEPPLTGTFLCFTSIILVPLVKSGIIMSWVLGREESPLQDGNSSVGQLVSVKWRSHKA